MSEFADHTPAPAGFKKIDLHIHTPLSACYVDHIKEGHPPTDPRLIVEAALDAGLDAIAITDHNGVEMVETLRGLAAGTALTILPGTELSTRGGHCLAIFDVDADLDPIRRMLEEIGFPREVWGDGFKRTAMWMDEVFARVAAIGGIGIAAHVDREPRGFLASDEKPSDKRRIYDSPHLAALEVTDERSIARYGEGRDLRYPGARACTQSSDAHAPREIGRRPIFLRLDTLSLGGIRAALANFREDVVFPAAVEAVA
jgi:hypothetical protein